MKAYRLFGHPIHPLLVHFPIALWSISLVWDGIGIVLGAPVWWAISFWSLCGGTAMALPAGIAGLLDYAALAQGSPAEKVAIRHMMTMAAAGTMWLLSLIIRGGPSVPSGGRLAAALACSAAGLLLTMYGGWLGGALVYRHGIGSEERSG